VKRVELLTGGASAIYGSDAVAGVVNFIMNDRFEGFQIDVNRSIYNHQQAGKADDALAGRKITPPGSVGGDGGVTDLSITMGSNFAGDKGNATFFFGYRNQDALTQAKRDFSSCSFGLSAANASGFSCAGSSTAAPGRFTKIDQVTGALISSSTYNADGSVRGYVGATDAYNFGPLNYFQRPDQRYTAAAYGRYNISDMARVYTEFNFMDDSSVAQIAPSGLFFGNTYYLTGQNPLITAPMQAALGLTAGSSTPVSVYIGRRNVEGGPRQDDKRHTMFRSVVGVKGDIGPWSYDVSAQVGRVIYQEEYLNDVSIVKAQRSLSVVANPAVGGAKGVAAGVPVCASVLDGTDPNCVPYNIFQPNGVTGAAINYLSTPGFQKGFTSQIVYTATGSVDLGTFGVKLPTANSGASLALGLENRQEKLQFDTDQAFSSGDLAGQGGPTIGQRGAYSVRDIFGEFKMPLIEKRPGAEALNLSASYRNSDYSTKKKTNTYGLGLDWTVLKGYQLRGSVQKAVRAPNIIDLYSAQSPGLTNLSKDPCAGTIGEGGVVEGGATATQCALTGVTAAQYGTIVDSPAGQYNALFGGNPNLKAETSNSYTFGLVLQPIKNLSMTLDYFSFKVEDTISAGVSPQQALTQCLATGNSAFCGLIKRATGSGTLWTGNAAILATNINLGKVSTSGLDLGVDYGFQMGTAGRLDVSLLGTLLQKYETEPVPGEGTYDCAGYFGNTCGAPLAKWRHTARVTWRSPYKLDLSATWRYFDGVKDEGSSSNAQLAGGLISPNGKFPSMSYFDVSAAYELTKQFSVRVGVRNLFDKNPPLALTGAPFGNGNTYPVVYDALGRHLSMNVTAKF
jgi:outer membrane receptor protein involved in Fe transport